MGARIRRRIGHYCIRGIYASIGSSCIRGIYASIGYACLRRVLISHTSSGHVAQLKRRRKMPDCFCKVSWRFGPAEGEGALGSPIADLR